MKFPKIKNLHKKIVVEENSQFVRIDVTGKRTLMGIIDSWVLNGMDIEFNRSYKKKGLYHIFMKKDDFKDPKGNMGSVESFINEVRLMEVE